ncbi:TIGR04086 family membrane protein [Thalassobacillus sp. CUG 92003]|uniref:TIGR04086 family membrane protein n=1 Tax=Thalassobacillus sp. CUG 92003 TaxID=2736641 RepID=UPI0015E6922F|nr:TIGR04086 family membrane protein [Thalassobacillus sp. CUG 92003]
MNKLIKSVTGYGIGLIAVFMLLTSFILAILLRFTTIDTSILQTIAMIAGLMIIALGGGFAAYKTGEKGWLSGTMTGVVFIVLILLIQLVVENQWVSKSQLLYFLAVLAVSWLGGMVGVNWPRRHTSHKK